MSLRLPPPRAPVTIIAPGRCPRPNTTNTSLTSARPRTVSDNWAEQALLSRFLSSHLPFRLCSPSTSPLPRSPFPLLLTTTMAELKATQTGPQSDVHAQLGELTTFSRLRHSYARGPGGEPIERTPTDKLDQVELESAQPRQDNKDGWKNTISLAFVGLGVIYGDLGTSPLYAMNGVFPSSGPLPSEEDIIGGVSA